MTVFSKHLKLPNKDYKRNEKSFPILAHLGGGMDCVTTSHAGVDDFSPTEKEQKFVPFSFHRNLPYLTLFKIFSF